MISELTSAVEGLTLLVFKGHVCGGLAVCIHAVLLGEVATETDGQLALQPGRPHGHRLCGNNVRNSD